MFVAMSRFIVGNEMELEVKQAFLDRPHLVDNEIGFIKMEVMNPVEKPEEFILITYWHSQQHWDEWYKGHKYKASHENIPKGLKLIPKSTQITYYNLFAQ